MTKQLVLSILTFTILTSCKKDLFINDIAYDIPRKADRITLTAKLVNEDTAIAYLSLSKYIMEYGKDEDPKIDSNFRVKLYKNNVLVGPMSPSDVPGYYVSNEIIEKEKTYRIEVEYDGYEKALGYCYIPQKPLIANGVIDTSNQSTTLSVDIFDDESNKNFYLIRTYNIDSLGKKEYTYFGIENPIPGTLLTDVSIIPGTRSSHYGYLSSLYISDKYYNGDRITVKVVANQYDNSYLALPYFEVVQITEGYFEYVKTLQLALNNDILGVIGEPVQVYSNIQNGYGVMAGATPTDIQTKW